MKRRLLSLLALPLLALPGCLYAHVKAPLDTDLNQTKLGAKQGEASSYQILWLVSWGDSSTHAAAEQGKITTINHADQEVFNVLWIVYSKWTTVVYGD